MKLSKKIYLICLIIISLLSFARFSDNIDSWFVDLASHFPAQYSLIALILFIISLWKKNASFAVLTSLLFILNVSAVLNFDKLVYADEEIKRSVRVYSANIHRHNMDMSSLNDDLMMIDPDIALLIEVTPDHLPLLHSVIESFPYHIEYTSVGALKIGMVLLSKFPILNHEKKQLSDMGNSFLMATLDIDNKKVDFFGIHAQNPSFIHEFQIRKKQFMSVAQEIAETDTPTILAGDFNATPFSPIFRKVLKVGSLKDSSHRFGWQPSWPVSIPLFWIPIDHVLVSSEIQMLNSYTGSQIGSDHFPVIAELDLG